jgi:hypothetical protein
VRAKFLHRSTNTTQLLHFIREREASGPGSRQGLNRVLGRPPKTPWTEGDWRAAFDRVRAVITPELDRIGIELHAQDLQNCLCEYAKYERVRLGEGKLKRKFRPRSQEEPRRGDRALTGSRGTTLTAGTPAVLE